MGSPSSEPEQQPGRTSPYLGLSPYAERDAALFFGRRRERELVVADLLTSPLTVLYGPSGVGKSSLLRAGVLPRLRRGEGLPAGGSRRVVAFVDAWHDDPPSAVLAAVAEAAGVEQGAGDAPFDEALVRLAQGVDGIVLLVLDQFEEYFLYHGGDDDPLHAGLPRIIGRRDVRVRVLISLREDALAELDRLEGSGAPLFGNLLRLGPLADGAAREAIEKPLEGSGVALEPGLAGEVVRLLHGREGVEPAYLQLVMRRLWDREVRDGSSVLRTSTLREMGSLREIVGAHLRESMDRLSPAGRRRVAEAFRYLVTPSGAKIAQRRRDLARLTGAEEDELAAPLEQLAAPDARILRPVDDAPTYEIFHDVLARPLLEWRERFEAARLRRRAVMFGMAAAAAAAIVLTLAAYILEPGWLERAELRAVDARFALRGDSPAESDIVIVDLDDASLAALGGGGDRIPRDDHARMIDALREAGAGVIAYDIEFVEPRPGDARLEAAIERAGPQLLLAATQIDSNGQGEVLGRPGDAWAATVGYAGFPLAEDDAYRQVDESVGLSGAERAEAVSSRLPSFAVLAAEMAGDPPGAFERAWIDYRGPAHSYRSYPFDQVLRDAGRSRFAGKVVVVGTSARKQGDLHPTAAGGERVMSGAEIQANAISTLRRDVPLRGAGGAVDVALIVLLGLLPVAIALLVGPKAAVALALPTAGIYLVAAQLLFSAGWIVPVVYPLLALVLASGGVAVARQVVGTRLR